MNLLFSLDVSVNKRHSITGTVEAIPVLFGGTQHWLINTISVPCSDFLEWLHIGSDYGDRDKTIKHLFKISKRADDFVSSIFSTNNKHINNAQLYISALHSGVAFICSSY